MKKFIAMLALVAFLGSTSLMTADDAKKEVKEVKKTEKVHKTVKKTKKACESCADKAKCTPEKKAEETKAEVK